MVKFIVMLSLLPKSST